MINKYIELLDTKITSIKGVGSITAGIILGEIGDITRFKNAEYFLEVSPSNVVAAASARANSSCTYAFPLHICPEKLSANNAISGISFLGDLGEVVKNNVRLLLITPI